MSDNDLDLGKSHSYHAADCFNRCWELIDKSNRSEEDNDLMVRLAETSLWHWTQVPDHTDENLSIGYWLLSRVYVLAGDKAKATRYAETCISVSESLSPFYKGYAYEAQARASVDGAESLAKAYEFARAVDDEGSQKQLIADLRDIGTED